MSSVPPVADRPGAPRGARFVRRWLLPLGISGFLLWLLTRGLSWQRIADSLAGAPPWLLAAYALLTLAGLFLRAVRFRLLLPAPRPATAPLALATLVQNCLGDLVPARLASLGSYVFILSRRLSVAPAVSAATFILSFALDLATLGPVLLLATAIRAGQLSPAFREHVPTGWVVAAALLLLGVACLIVLRFGAIVRSSGRVLTAVVAVLGMRDAPSIGAATEGLEKAAAALDRIDTARAFAGAFSLSLLIRMAKYVALMALMHGILQGAGGVDRVPSFWDLVIGVSVTEGLAALPLPTLGQFGVWEGGMIGVLVLLGLPREPATIAAVAIHAVTQGFEFLLGMIALGLILLLYRRPAASSPDSPAA